MGGGTRVKYEAPKIEKDKSFEKYLEYQIQRDKDISDAALQAKKMKPEARGLRNEAGAAGYDAYASNIQSQLGAGLISFNDAQSRLEGYRSKYDMVPGCPTRVI